jgi:membrane protease YdiL (CAAX protease family)
MGSGVTTWTSRQRILAILGLLLAFGFVLIKVIFPEPSPTGSEGAIHTIVVQWGLSIVVALIAFNWLGLLPSELGLLPLRMLDWLIMLVTLTLAMVAAGMINRFVPSSGSEKLSTSWLFQLPLSIRLLLALTAGVCEEFLFRGFGISVLARFTKNRWLAGLLSLLAFTVGHVALFGWTSLLIAPAVLGAILTLLFLLRGNLFNGVIVHTIIDVIGLVVGPMMSSKS